MTRYTILTLILFAGLAQGIVWTDKDISQAIEQRIKRDPMVTGFGLTVACKDGVVTLRGHVTNLLEKQRAQRIAASRKGVRSVLNQVVVDAGPIDDASITAHIKEALADDPAFGDQDIKVETLDGFVRLAGEVDLYDMRRLIEFEAAPVIGVRGIENQVIVKADKKPRSDEEIRGHIQKRFRADVWLDGLFIAVTVHSGTVALEGSVGSLEQLKRAMDKAWVRGVASVDSSKLTVDPMLEDSSRRAVQNPKLSDSEIRDAIKDSLTLHSWIVGSDIDVAVESGVASLRGKVSSLRIKTAVRRTAQNTVGVVRVNDFVTVGAGKVPVADTVVLDRLQRNLKRNFYTSRYPLETEVEDGKVTLRGVVETSFERNQAEMAASSTYGVRAVENQIRTNRLLRGYGRGDLEELADANTMAPLDGSSKKSDAEIKKDVESEIFWSWWVDSDAVKVSVKRGEVTLSGHVDSEREQRAAVANAFDGGAVTVVNDLKLRK